MSTPEPALPTGPLPLSDQERADLARFAPVKVLRTKPLSKERLTALRMHRVLQGQENEAVREIQAGTRERFLDLAMGAAEASGIEVPGGWSVRDVQTKDGTVYEFLPPPPKEPAA